MKDTHPSITQGSYFNLKMTIDKKCTHSPNSLAELDAMSLFHHFISTADHHANFETLYAKQSFTCTADKQVNIIYIYLFSIMHYSCM